MDIKSVKEFMYRLNVNSKYDMNLLKNCFKEILNVEDINLRNTLLGSVLTALMVKGPTKDEIFTLLKVTFSLDKYNPYNRKLIEMGDNTKTVAIVGSGKKGIKTINISSASAFLAASLGAYVVKPGSFSTSSITGSADFMDIIGAKCDISLDKSISILKQCGFAFFSIENIIPKFDSIYGGNFYVPHVLSFGLAALVCPVKTDAILYGLAHPNIELALDVIESFGLPNVMVVSSSDDNIHFLDEFGIYGITNIIEKNTEFDDSKLVEFEPAKLFNLPKYTSKDIQQGKDKNENIKYILKALNGEGTRAHEDIICINCSAILYLAGIVNNLKDGFDLSKKAIKTGQGLKKVEEYVLLTGGKLDNIRKILEGE